MPEPDRPEAGGGGIVRGGQVEIRIREVGEVEGQGGPGRPLPRRRLQYAVQGRRPVGPPALPGGDHDRKRTGRRRPAVRAPQLEYRLGGVEHQPHRHVPVRARLELDHRHAARPAVPAGHQPDQVRTDEAQGLQGELRLQRDHPGEIQAPGQIREPQRHEPLDHLAPAEGQLHYRVVGHPRTDQPRGRREALGVRRRGIRPRPEQDRHRGDVPGLRRDVQGRTAAAVAQVRVAAETDKLLRRRGIAILPHGNVQHRPSVPVPRIRIRAAPDPVADGGHVPPADRPVQLRHGSAPAAFGQPRPPEPRAPPDPRYRAVGNGGPATMRLRKIMLVSLDCASQYIMRTIAGIKGYHQRSLAVNRIRVDFGVITGFLELGIGVG